MKEKKQAEKEKEISEKQYRNIFNSAAEKLKIYYDIINRSPGVVFLWKNEVGWPVEFVSENVKKIFCYTADEFISGKVEYMKTVHPDDSDRVAEEVRHYSEEKGKNKFVHKPYRIITKDGDVKWIDDRTIIRRDKSGVITHYDGIILDITERKQAEEAMEKSEEHYRTLFDLSPSGIIVIDSKGNILEVNNSFCKYNGYTPDELKGNNVKFLMPDDKRGDMDLHIHEILIDKTLKHEVINITKDGEYRNVELYETKISLPDGTPGILSISNDITERKRIEKELQNQLNKLEAYHKITMGREGRIIEIKQEVNNLLERLGEERKYGV